MVKNFSTEWVLWFHSIKDNQWNKSSYKRLYSIKSYLDYQLIIETFQQNHYQNGMFFIMKSDIFPNWEDPTNRMGGCLSFKIKSVNVINEWNKIFTMDEFEINLKLSESPTDNQIKKLRSYFKDIPLPEILSGLKSLCLNPGT